jgi:phage terminase small subunit
MQHNVTTAQGVQTVRGVGTAHSPRATAAPPAETKKRGKLAERAALALDERELAFALDFCETRNASASYMRTHITQGMTPTAIRTAAYRCAIRPSVQRYVQELKLEAARAAVVEVSELLAYDLALVQAFETHGNEIAQHVLECCRYCHGSEHRWQWVDLNEYLKALDTAEADNDARRERKQNTKALPTDDGGYGFMRTRDPHVECPQCEGRGVPQVYFADTSKLVGPAALLVKGVKQGANGQLEVLLHDVDKAKERLLKAAGAFGDDAASVARGAAAGAAAGVAAAHQLAHRIDTMTEDEARKAYLTLV